LAQNVYNQHGGKTMEHNLIAASGYLRLANIIGNKKKGIPALIPVSRSTWYSGIQSGRFPKPIHLTERAVAWRVSDIQQLLEGIGKETQ
jgi:predicted DNA-binding transcriptional regulator AlpA